MKLHLETICKKLVNKGLLVILTAVFLAACAPITPAPTGGSWPAPPPKETTPKPTTQPDKSTAPIKSGENKEVSSAVTSLLNKGWALYKKDDYRAALGMAERAQRIDSRSPDVYLLMASAQFSLYQRNVAEQLTRRGIALAASGSSVKRKLQSLLVRIQASGR